MKKTLFFSLFIFAINIGDMSLNAQITQRNLLQKCITEDYTKSIIPQNKFKPFPQTAEGWKLILPDTVIAKLVKRGEEALPKDFKNIPATAILDFKRNGNRSYYEKMLFEKRNQLWDLVIAESLEGKGRFLDQIINGVWSISEESFWGGSAHLYLQKTGIGLPDVEDPIVDLFSSETGAVMAWTDYFVGNELDRISPIIRSRIRYEINKRIMVPMATTKYPWLGGGNSNVKLNNWAPWIMSNYLTINLLMEKDEPKRINVINSVTKIIDQYINGLGEDGGCEEGPTYWIVACGCVYDALNLLNDASSGKINIYKDPLIQKMGSYIYKTHIANDYFINVADAHPTFKPDGLMIYRFGKSVSDQSLMDFGSWVYHTISNEEAKIENFNRSRSLYNMRALKDCASYPSTENDVSDAWFSDVQLMASRSHNGLFLSTHGGTNGESHNHNDVGDFSVYADGYPVIIDVGSGTYTARTFSADRYKLWFNTSPYHNLPIINGKEQSQGIHFAASGLIYKNSKNNSQLSMDISSAYPTNTGLKSWKRIVELNKTKGIRVNDNYIMNTNLNSLQQVFMSVCDIDIAKKGKIIFKLPNQSQIYLDYNANLWDISKERMELKSQEDQGLKSSWKGKNIWRILLNSKFHNKSKTITYYIHK